MEIHPIQYTQRTQYTWIEQALLNKGSQQQSTLHDILSKNHTGYPWGCITYKGAWEYSGTLLRFYFLIWFSWMCKISAYKCLLSWILRICLLFCMHIVPQLKKKVLKRGNKYIRTANGKYSKVSLLQLQVDNFLWKKCEWNLPWLLLHI